jgi:hypothetical protein
MEYQTVYDVTQQGYNWWWLLIPAFILAVGLASWKAREKFGPQLKLPGYARAIGSFALGLGVLLTICISTLGLTVSYIGYVNAKQILETGKAQLVEGLVENFAPQPAFDNGVESFTVSNVKFEYSIAWISHGFNKSSTHGGPIDRDGIQVRIHYYYDQSENRNVILQLEVMKQP